MKPHSSFTPPTHFARRHDLDALRVIAFGLLIFYHVGMAYSGWDWHVLSAHAGEAGGEIIQPLMRALNPWRLPLLFLISGAALRFAIDKAQARDKSGAFLGRQSLRLFLPLLIGMFFIVAPQSWAQLKASGEIQTSFLGFYPGYLADDYSITTPTWNHLWYVAYMFVYTPLIWLFAPVLRRFPSHLDGWHVLALFFVPHMIIRLTLDPYFPTTHDLTSDWANHAHSFMWVMTGFVIAKSAPAWSAIDRLLPWLGLTTIGLMLYLGVEWNRWDIVAEQPVRLWVARVGRVLYTATVILSLLGLAQRHLSKPSRLTQWAGSSVFCWYILHQTLIVLGVVWLSPLNMSFPVEGVALIAFTVVSTLGLTEVLRRTGPLRILWGFKAKQRRSDVKNPILDQGVSSETGRASDPSIA